MNSYLFNYKYPGVQPLRGWGVLAFFLPQGKPVVKDVKLFQSLKMIERNI